MRVGEAHLGYCTNIHPGESWDEVRANLERYVVAVKRRVCPDAPFGIGLRLSARAAKELMPRISEFRDWLDRNGLYVFTINGFPYGNFHGARIKEKVYLPDWRDPERVAYTCLLGMLLQKLLPIGVFGTISTVPGCFRARGVDAADIAENLRRTAYSLSTIGIWLAVEPEPSCLLETLDETAAFLDDHNLSDVGVCVDVCHAAVEYESVTALKGVSIAKLQLSCGLRVSPVDDTARAELGTYADDVYLHQVVARRRDGTLARYVDLPEAMLDPAEADEWRVHFHVPIFREGLGRFASTQPFLEEVLSAVRLGVINSTHLEVETYTWNMLPAEFRAEPVEDAIARELLWAKERIGTPGGDPDDRDPEPEAPEEEYPA